MEGKCVMSRCRGFAQKNKRQKKEDPYLVHLAEQETKQERKFALFNSISTPTSYIKPRRNPTATSGTISRGPKPSNVDPSDDFPVAVGEDEEAEFKVKLAVVPAVFVVLAVDPEPAVVVAAPATLTLARVAGGWAVLACVSCSKVSFTQNIWEVLEGWDENIGLQFRHNHPQNKKPPDPHKPVPQSQSALQRSTMDIHHQKASKMDQRKWGDH
jgi:hypothetical protein